MITVISVRPNMEHGRLSALILELNRQEMSLVWQRAWASARTKADVIEILKLWGGLYNFVTKWHVVVRDHLLPWAMGMLVHLTSLRELSFEDVSLVDPEEIYSYFRRAAATRPNGVLSIMRLNVPPSCKDFPWQDILSPRARLLIHNLYRNAMIETSPERVREPITRVDFSNKVNVIVGQDYDFIHNLQTACSPIRILTLESPSPCILRCASSFSDINSLTINNVVFSPEHLSAFKEIILRATNLTLLRLYKIRFECDIEEWARTIGKAHCLVELDVSNIHLSAEDELATHALSNLQALHRLTIETSLISFSWVSACTGLTRLVVKGCEKNMTHQDVARIMNCDTSQLRVLSLGYFGWVRDGTESAGIIAELIENGKLPKLRTLCMHAWSGDLDKDNQIRNEIADVMSEALQARNDIYFST